MSIKENGDRRDKNIPTTMTPNLEVKIAAVETVEADEKISGSGKVKGNQRTSSSMPITEAAYKCTSEETETITLKEENS
jgi:hypothetical protein